MKTLRIDVKSFEETLDELEAVWDSGVAAPTARHSFVSYDLLHKILAPGRMDILKTMTGAGPLSIREVARRVGRDVKGVHTDVTALIHNGIVEKTADGKVTFPYDSIRFEFEISAAA